MNSIDLCAIVPFFVTLATVFEDKHALRNSDNMLIFSTGDKQEKGASLSMLRVIRLVRVFRLDFVTHCHPHFHSLPIMCVCVCMLSQGLACRLDFLVRSLDHLFLSPTLSCSFVSHFLF